MSKIEITPQTLSKFGKRLKDILNSKFDTSINLNSSLEILAQTFGAKNLHELQKKFQSNEASVNKNENIAKDISLIIKDYSFILVPAYLIVSLSEVNRIEESKKDYLSKKENLTIEINISELSLSAVVSASNIDEAMTIYKDKSAIKCNIPISDAVGFVNAAYHGDTINNYSVSIELKNGKLFTLEDEKKQEIKKQRKKQL